MKINKILNDLEIAKYHLINARRLMKSIKDSGSEKVSKQINELTELIKERNL